jgi:flagellar protein FliJ
MTRSERMQPVQRVIDEAERKQAEKLAASERRVAEHEKKLQELKKYCTDYQSAFNDRVRAGISNAGLRDYRIFLGRLNDAVRQQAQALTAVCAERDQARQGWQTAACRAKSIDTVVEQWRVDERRGADRREQRDSDERAQHRRPTPLD